MKPEEFILKIVRAYQAARLPVAKTKLVRRGRSRSISSIAEDLLADFLVSNDKTIDAIYVDQPIFVEKGKKRLFPDLAIVRNRVIDSLIDLKLDIGWHRDGLTDLCKEHRKTARAIRGKASRLRDGLSKELHEYQLSKSLSYNVVMISRTNINPEILKEHEKKIAKFAPDVELFILCDTGHPNNYDLKPEDVLETLSINNRVFSSLLEKI